MCAALFGLIAVCSTMVLPACGAGAGRAPARPSRAQQERRPIEEDVQVAVGRGLDAVHAGHGADLRGQLLGDDARRLAQAAGQVERHGRAEVAHRAVGRRFDGNRDARVLAKAVGLSQNRAHTVLESFVKRQYHACRFVDSTQSVRYALRATSVDAGHVRGHLAFYSELMDMVDAGIGRLLIASLHQGIADVSPTRLDFYENWLSPTGLRDGRMGLAPLGAVLSFLNREEPPADRVIPAHAGACAAEWTYADASAFRKRLTKRLPLSPADPRRARSRPHARERDHQPVEGEDAA